MGRLFVIVAFALFSATVLTAQESAVRLSVSGVKPSSDTVYGAVFNNPEGYRRNVPIRTLTLQAAASTIEANLSLPPGEYVFSLYQDLNSNGKLDSNFIGIPREPVGISNYEGKGPPGGFDKHKVRVPAGGFSLEIKLIAINP